jgi:hypothetical protein
MITDRAPPVSHKPIGPARILRYPYINKMEGRNYTGYDEDKDKDPHPRGHFINRITHFLSSEG